MEVLELTEDDLQSLYLKHNSVWKVGDELGLKGQTIHKWLTELGIITKMNYFTDLDFEILKQEYKKYRDIGQLSVLALKMKRTVSFLNRKAKEVGLTDSAKRISMKPFASDIGLRTKSWIKEKGHPKGMLGKTHTDEVKKRMGISSSKNWANPNSKLNSKEATKRRSENMSRLRVIGIVTSNYSNTKHGWFDKNGVLIFMRSTWEINYAHYLTFLQHQCIITYWEYEVETFLFDYDTFGFRSYKPDFRVTLADGSIQYHEVKGWLTELAKSKIEAMSKVHPSIVLVVIDQVEYNKIKKEKSGLITNWGVVITKANK